MAHPFLEASGGASNPFPIRSKHAAANRAPHTFYDFLSQTNASETKAAGTPEPQSHQAEPNFACTAADLLMTLSLAGDIVQED